MTENKDRWEIEREEKQKEILKEKETWKKMNRAEKISTLKTTRRGTEMTLRETAVIKSSMWKVWRKKRKREHEEDIEDNTEADKGEEEKESSKDYKITMCLKRPRLKRKGKMTENDDAKAEEENDDERNKLENEVKNPETIVKLFPIFQATKSHPRRKSAVVAAEDTIALVETKEEAFNPIYCQEQTNPPLITQEIEAEEEDTPPAAPLTKAEEASDHNDCKERFNPVQVQGTHEGAELSTPSPSHSIQVNPIFQENVTSAGSSSSSSVTSPISTSSNASQKTTRDTGSNFQKIVKTSKLSNYFPPMNEDPKNIGGGAGIILGQKNVPKFMSLCPPQTNLKAGVKKSRPPKIKFDPRKYKKMDEFNFKNKITGPLPSSTASSNTIVEITVQASTPVHREVSQAITVHRVAHNSTVTVRECPESLQTAEIETHLTDFQLSPGEIARTREQCPDRSRDCPDPQISTHHNTSKLAAESVAHSGAVISNIDITFTTQDQLTQNTEPGSSRICKNEMFM